jgi:hypothetical protein
MTLFGEAIHWEHEAVPYAGIVIPEDQSIYPMTDFVYPKHYEGILTQCF